MKKNITRVDALNTAINMITETIELNGSGDPDEAKLTETVEVLTSIRDTISKANSRKSDKPTKTQLENAALADVVADVLSNAAAPLTVSEIMKADSRLSTLSNQKVSAVIRGMGDRVTRHADKRVTRFSLT